MFRFHPIELDNQMWFLTMRHGNLEQGDTELEKQLGSCLEFAGEK